MTTLVSMERFRITTADGERGMFRSQPDRPARLRVDVIYAPWYSGFGEIELVKEELIAVRASFAPPLSVEVDVLLRNGPIQLECWSRTHDLWQWWLFPAILFPPDRGSWTGKVQEPSNDYRPPAGWEFPVDRGWQWARVAAPPWEEQGT